MGIQDESGLTLESEDGNDIELEIAMSLGETFQAAGSRAVYQTANEASWGTLNTSVNWRRMRLLPGEAMDINMALYKSQEMRGDRMQNASVRGSQKPAGTIPFELSANGWNHFFYHLLGGAVTTTAGGASYLNPGGPVTNPITGPTNVLATPAAPTGTASATGGVLAAGSYVYEVSAIDYVGETQASPASTAVVFTTGTTNKITLGWTAVSGATGYKIFGRTSGSLLYIGTVSASASPAFIDTGTSIGTTAPLGAGLGTGGGYYQQVFSGGLDVPAGFTLEKGFTDAGLYYPFYGCRVNKMDLDFAIDKIPTGTFDLFARQAGDPSQTSLNTGSLPVAPTEDPFTSSQAFVYQAGSGTPMGTCESLKLSIMNSFYDSRGYILGSPLRQNLRPGDRIVEASGEFFFTDAELYEMAIRGDRTSLAIMATNGVYSVRFDMFNWQFLPNLTTPKAKDQGPISISMKGESLPDPNSGSNITMTIKTAEEYITT